MTEFVELETCGWKHAITGMRNPMNSWEKSDSGECDGAPGPGKEQCESCKKHFIRNNGCWAHYRIGERDYELAMKLVNRGPVHAKFRRMIVVYTEITAPLYWWKQFDTYKVGTSVNSCSTMHKIHAKEFGMDDFSHEHLDIRTIELLKNIINVLNGYRNLYANYNADDFEITGCPSKKDIWWQMIQILPDSYNQKRTVMMNYEVLSNIYKSRKKHKLDEWNDFCEWIEALPYPELITG